MWGVALAQEPLNNADTLMRVEAPALPHYELRPAANDTLNLPLLTRYGQMPYMSYYPMSWNGYGNWGLHRGLNLNLGASVFGFFGEGAPSGAGYAQNISAMYAVPLSKKLSIAIGGYFTNVFWAHDSYYDAGFNAVLGYRFNEHWEAYVFGQKSITNKKIPLPLYDACELGDRIGAAIKYNFNPAFSIQVSVSKESRPWQRLTPVDIQDYP